MPTILTPISLWKDFDDSLPIEPVVLEEKAENSVKYEYVNFFGRDTGEGRVKIFGVYARSETNPSRDGVLIIPDGNDTVDEAVLKMFVERGYSAFMVDIRGQYENAERFTVYPPNVSYANFLQADRAMNYVDDNAQKTSWYEWVAVGLYALKFLSGKVENKNIGLVGIRDGGEVAWKLAYAGKFACAVTVCADGWKAYKGQNKFGDEESELDEERYRFIAGIDSQSYAPYVRCPVLMLCSINESGFDYDRAYDTYSRINPEYFGDSVIAYSMKSNADICIKSTVDMFMFLDGHVKQRLVFIPEPAEIEVTVDENDNLIAKTTFDDKGVVEKFGLYIAEDCKNPVLRDWVEARYKTKSGNNEHQFYLDIYEKTSILFAICYVTYSNGFTVWSKINVKKISGQFRNSQPKCKILCSVNSGKNCFVPADSKCYAVGGAFVVSNELFPKTVEKAKGLKGVYSPCGLSTYRINNPAYYPNKDSMLKFDICADDNLQLELVIQSVSDGAKYTSEVYVVGGVWQSVLLKSKMFKNENGVALADFTQSQTFTVNGKCGYAINNVMWL